MSKEKFVRLAYRHWLPVVALVVLMATCAVADQKAPPQSVDGIVAHNLSHHINNLYVAVSLGLLLIPSFIALRRGKQDLRFWWVLDAIVCDYLLVDCIFRRFLRLPRPDDPLHAGFPSGHATFAFALAWLIYERYPRWGPLWFAIAVAIGWSRVEVHAHFIYQVLAGALFGVAIGWLASHRREGVILPRVLRA